MPQIKVALSADFLLAFSKIPRRQQGKVREFIEKFQQNPTAPGINYEKINQARDPHLRSVRIDQDYRGIISKPDKGDVYILLWVDSHEEAYQWATRRRCVVNPATGALQVLTVDEETVVEMRQVVAPPLFAKVADKDLLCLGVPETDLSLVRNLNSEEQLDSARDRLPVEAYEALSLLVAGFSLEEVLNEVTERKSSETTVDTEDFSKALEHPDALRRFHVVEDDLELAAILNAPLEKWRVFLHPSQRKLVEKDVNGPIRVLGGAGTGKTVVAMHRAKWLIEKRLHQPTDRLLLTTFTRNLSSDIRANLGKICSEEVLRKIEVVNLDSWVVDFLKKQGFQYRVAYNPEAQPLWEQAVAVAPSLSLPTSFFKDEWDKVVIPQGITSHQDYLRASRLGRGRSISRKERASIWPVFEEYRALLREKGLIDVGDAMREARMLLANKGDILPYRAIIVDEAQDMGPQAFQLLRQMIPQEKANDLFIVGDAHQRIYGQKVVLGRCGINVRGRRSQTLKINYRTTEQIRSWAVSLLEGKPIDDLDGGLDSSKGYKSLMQGMAPEIRNFPSMSEELDFLQEILTQKKNEGTLSGACLVARTKTILEDYGSQLRGKGIETYLLDRDTPDDSSKPGLRLATIHRVKGLEFDEVFIVSASDGVHPLDRALQSATDETSEDEVDLQERALLYVASTRAKRHVWITSYGKPSRYLDSI